MTGPRYLMRLSRNVLNHMGLHLYSNTPAVVAEVIANAWDADATEVDVDLDAEATSSRQSIAVDDPRYVALKAFGETGISAKSVGRCKARVRAFWDGRSSQPLRERRRDWLRCVRGWWQYYRLCDVRWQLKALSSWTRRHMRKAFWLRWHDWRGRRDAMARLGATGRTLRLAHSGRGAWHGGRRLR